MAENFIPRTDADFNNWLSNLLTYSQANLVTLGLVVADTDPVDTAQSAWASDYLAHQNAQLAAEQARQDKDASRAVAEVAARALVAKLQASPSVDDGERAALGIPIRDTEPTAAPVPESRPAVILDISQRLKHKLSFADEATPTIVKKPDGVQGCEIWVKVDGDPPVDPSELKYVATDGRTPAEVEYTGADAGKVAHYMCRWINTRGETGPWSVTVSGTIAA